MAAGLSPRGGDEILSSSPQEAAHPIAKLQPGILPGGQAMESIDHARHQDLSRRLLEELERLAAADDIPALRGKRPEAVRRTIPPLAPLDSDWFKAAVQKNTVSLATLPEDPGTITSSAKDLKAFCRKYADNREAFKLDPDAVLKRQ